MLVHFISWHDSDHFKNTVMQLKKKCNGKLAPVNLHNNCIAPVLRSSTV